ncbi:hypothetical protein FNL55_09570 [Tardiphaga sp. vice352]|uniref:hypothetical protein n=1 Tax=unclassified Tardiphaga TaxID=2631404 RepID=UPI0011623C70|nr:MULTISPECIES: hypothetical protein [unclassified Tardiphaga]QDM16248.1 hypothetical protein FNL53_10245 [Tardiphaga sp. vice278]QDM21272.1 hypothetical protein FIU28_09160 [Tardiphaga sp. vice154]QDM26457.1 hypothetical protein FNL56_10405 [Tardiphaga sp. vice304]QDM31523.1 hypothetical protein FNL55_09570 [Tardiphaga sp. vice352]
MSEATLILPNMRGGCATVGGTVHTLFRVSNRSHRPMAQPGTTTDGPGHVGRDQPSGAAAAPEPI